MAAPPASSSDAGRQKRNRSGVVIPHKPRWHQRLVAWLVFAAIRSVAFTLRYRWIDRSGLADGTRSGPAIYCLWHNRLANSMTAYWGYVQLRSRTPGLAAMVSASKDGGFLAGVLDWFRVQPVRGSSSRRGAQAMLELTTWGERGYDLAITPDGPRGPCYQVQDGVTSLAQLTGLPIVPFTCNLSWKIRVKSWDRFQIPLPFSRCEMIFAEPIRVSREAADAEREALRQRLESALRGISRD